MTEFFAVAAQQRAHRQFLDKPVDDELIAQLLAIATRAPSAENRQPWEFIVVRDAEMRRDIGLLMERAWEHGGRAFSAPRLDTITFNDVDAAMTGGFARAPVHIVVCADLERGMEITIGASLFPAVQNLLLGATALGLGSALTTIAIAFDAELRTMLALPETVRVVAIVPVGWPARSLGASKREPFERHTHRERYGQDW